MSDVTEADWPAEMLAAHTPSNQKDNPCDRCAYCNYTRHPCDVYDLAEMVIELRAIVADLAAIERKEIGTLGTVAAVWRRAVEATT